jgi:hypothetical protein
MDKIAIARLNIEHYRRRLAQEKDEGTRQIILRLLAEQEKEFFALTNPSEDRRQRQG